MAITSFHRGDSRPTVFIVPQKEGEVISMMGFEDKKEQEIRNMVMILKQIDLPDILLLARDANTLLMRQKESENISILGGGEIKNDSVRSCSG